MELLNCLKQWAYNEAQGIPQNRDASSILGNIYMLPVDQAMLAKGYQYFRYMDDIRIVADNRYKARAALQDLICELRKYGLNVNGAKTKILTPGTDEYVKELGAPEAELEAIEEMWRSRSGTVIRRSLPHLRSYALKLIAAGRTHERGFRFCINKFCNLALCEEFEVEQAFFSDIVDAAIKELDEQPFASDQLIRFLKAAPVTPVQMEAVVGFIRDRSRSIYAWQGYLVWQLLAYHKHFSDPALEAARAQALDGSSSGVRAGAIHYLGVGGRTEDTQLIMKNFQYLTTPIEIRSALIAIHDVPFRKGVEQDVKPHIQPHDQGVYTTLNKEFRGEHIRRLEPVTFSMMYDEVSQYDG